ncbi:hypothetical protein CC1G_12363 [Coprinopsis cinerea okayama7|uniref:Uncharacterized protein n=1 Tax=Coprinopsis cinerea (strain Okayama-7 / 130 / ATCC MYA-4618 / FGSC 9003) TaxID=240176 RepID=A8P573_COPC7|nr:hypothetical protein CC1G_12363 [Coprinopsis cinerea okayama7\|eukprot:XP_001838889.1 hypothetical protein CC1G_12363 [Coprinopsis cinerea okayama7\
MDCLDDSMWQLSDFRRSGRRIAPSQGIDPNLQDDFGWTALMLASRRSGAADIVDRLLQENRVDVHLRAKDGLNALIVASRYDEDRAVERLLRVDGIEVNAQDESGRTALMWAAYVGDRTSVELLLGHKEVQADMVDREGNSIAFLLLKWNTVLSHEFGTVMQDDERAKASYTGSDSMQVQSTWKADAYGPFA